ncbi:hypothetical protein B0J15DRAFT_375969, partial [Fusarium solani]
TLFEVYRTDRSAPANRPFLYIHQQKTKTAYAEVGTKLLMYIMRCFDIEDLSERPPFKITPRQQAAYEELILAAGAYEDIWLRKKGDPSDQDVLDAFEQLKHRILRLFIAVLNHTTKNSEFESVIVSFIQGLNITPDGSWHSFETFTPFLAALIGISRLLILKAAHQKQKQVVE